jgi:hypothetical protein
MKKYFLILLSIAVFSLPVSAQPSPPLGPPEVPAGIPSNDLGLSLFIGMVKTKLQTAIGQVNHSIDSMSSSTGVKATLSHTITTRVPRMDNTTSYQMPNEKFARIDFNVVYTISNISYHSIPYFSRKLFQSIAVTMACNKWFTTEGSVSMKARAEKPLLDQASFSEQALNFFIANTLSNLVDRKLNSILSGMGGTLASIDFSNIKCNCMSLTPGIAPNFENGFIRFAYKTSKGDFAAAETSNNLTISFKSIKRLPITGFPDPVDEAIRVEFYANHSSDLANVNAIRAGQELVVEDKSVKISRPGNDGMLVVIANITSTATNGSLTYSNSLVFRKDKNFGTGMQKLIVMKAIDLPASTGPDGRPIKPRTVYWPQYELIFEIKGDGIGMRN